MSYHYVRRFKTEILFEVSKTSFQMSLAFSLEMLTLLWRTVYSAAIKLQSLFDILTAQRKGVKTE